MAGSGLKVLRASFNAPKFTEEVMTGYGFARAVQARLITA